MTLEQLGVEGCDTHQTEYPPTAFDSIVGLSYAWIQPAMGGKQYFKSAIGNLWLRM